MRSLIGNLTSGADVPGMLYGRFTTEGTESTEKKRQRRKQFSRQKAVPSRLQTCIPLCLFFSVLSVPSVVNLLVESVGRRRIWALSHHSRSRA
jgi:hypothetical protein